MKKRKKKRQIKLIIIWSLIVVYLISMLFIFSRQYNNTECKAIEINILDSLNIKLIEKKDILLLVNKYTNNKTVGFDFKTIKLNKLEEKLNQNPYLKSVEVYRKSKGVLRIEITQRKPILRIINNKGNSYYIDKEAVLIPFTKNYSSFQIIANGNIELDFNFTNKDSLPVLNKNNENHKILNDLYTLAYFINENEFYSAQIEQIYVNQLNEFELIPRVGNHLIEFGTVENFEIKFENLKIFYEKALSKVGWNKYTKISVKYNNQIVGSN